jgi:acyl carrier protein
VTIRADKEFFYRGIRHVVIEKQAGEARRTNAMKADATYSTPDYAVKIYAVVARCFGVPRRHFTARTSLVEDLGVDSIDLLALAIELEEEFDIVISDQTLGRIRTIGDTVPCVANALELRRNSRDAASEYQTKAKARRDNMRRSSTIRGNRINVSPERR